MHAGVCRERSMVRANSVQRNRHDKRRHSIWLEFEGTIGRPSKSGERPSLARRSSRLWRRAHGSGQTFGHVLNHGAEPVATDAFDLEWIAPGAQVGASVHSEEFSKQRPSALFCPLPVDHQPIGARLPEHVSFAPCISAFVLALGQRDSPRAAKALEKPEER